jgi:hypothetical protein
MNKRISVFIGFILAVAMALAVCAAVLPDLDRRQVWSEYMETSSVIWESLPAPKQDILDAVIATDAWIENNQTSFNNSLPTSVKNNFTQKQKARLFMAVAKKRFDIQ